MSFITQQLLDDMECLPPDMQEEALDFVRFLKAKRSKLENATVKPAEANGLKAVEILNALAARGTAFREITDPVAWQKDIRQGRPLPNNR
jgi:hypothetical protein